MIQANAPTANKSDDDIEDFYGQLDALCKITKHSHITIMLGDFNAKVDNGSVKEYVGPYDLGERNE